MTDPVVVLTGFVFSVGVFYAITRSDIKNLQHAVESKADTALEEAKRKADTATVEALAREVARKADSALVETQYEAILRELTDIKGRLP